MPESAKPRVAVVGLGSMGFGMATSLRRAGFDVTGCDVSAESVARFVADGGNGAKIPAEAAKAAEEQRVKLAADRERALREEAQRLLAEQQRTCARYLGGREPGRVVVVAARAHAHSQAI